MQKPWTCRGGSPFLLFKFLKSLFCVGKEEVRPTAPDLLWRGQKTFPQFLLFTLWVVGWNLDCQAWGPATIITFWPLYFQLYLVCVYTCVGAAVEVKGITSGVASPSASCPQGWSWGCQVWPQGLTLPSRLPALLKSLVGKSAFLGMSAFLVLFKNIFFL